MNMSRNTPTERENHSVKISASLMCADMHNLGREIGLLEEAGVDWMHLDVMDGVFVPNFAFSTKALETLRPLTQKPFDVHIMGSDPSKHIDRVINSGADIISIHVESSHVKETLAKIRAAGIKAGLAISPETPYQEVLPFLDDIDLALFMTVSPGFAGQKFIPDVISKIYSFKRHITEQGRPIEISVDGGIGTHTIPVLASAGATIFVGGTTGLFIKDRQFMETVATMRTLAAHHQQDHK
ncbi:MAG: ribulose-phosphate 3-epimerase [Nanoarchaeota archaeon]